VAASTGAISRTGSKPNGKCRGNGRNESRLAALIAGGQKVEHYEIASYGTLAYFADLLGHEPPKALLGQTLDEEKAADAKLNQIAKSKVNREALMPDGRPESTSLRMPQGVRRVAASMGLAQDSSSPSRRTTKTSKRRRSTGKRRT
jgi:hypothetical protein